MTYTTLRTLAGQLVNDSTSTTLDFLIDTLYNEEYKRVASLAPWNFLQRTRTATTVASQQFYELPNDVDQIVNVTVLNGNLLYTPRPVQSRTEWDNLNYSTAYSSNYPQFYFVFNNTLGFWPKPSAASQTITYSYRKKVAELSIADYTTGNISAATNGDETITGAGTTFTAPMAGRFLQITETSTANGSGDNLWYEIASITSATELELVDKYVGLTISTNTAYTIGQMPLLPEAYHQVPLYRALYTYYTSVQPEPARADRYLQQWEEGTRNLQEAYGKKVSNVVLDEGDYPQLNPNLFISAS